MKVINAGEKAKKWTDGMLPCVATIGFFDGVHEGHRCLVQQVRRLAEEKGLASALVTFPIHPRKVMQSSFCPELLNTAEEKINLLETTGVDYCFMLEFTPELSLLTAQAFMKKVLKEQFHVACLVIGYDHQFGHNRSEGFDDYVRYGREMGIEVCRADALTLHDGAIPIHVSSSSIRSQLREGQVEWASRLLGYNYFVEGEVVIGHQMGRKLGFPTANIAVNDSCKLLPANGVYAVRVYLDGLWYKGMLNIGTRPTLDNGSQQSVEVHILHFQGDVYHHTIRIDFVKRLRDEQKFNSLDELIAQLHKDAEETEQI